MEVTKLLLDSIHWTRMTIMNEKDENVLVLECNTQEQALTLLNILIENDFRFSFGETENKLPTFVINFIESGLDMFIIPADNTLFKYFNEQQIQLITTGFDAGEGNVAFHNERIEISGLDYSKLN